MWAQLVLTCWVKRKGSILFSPIFSERRKISSTLEHSANLYWKNFQTEISALNEFKSRYERQFISENVSVQLLVFQMQYSCYTVLGFMREFAKTSLTFNFGIHF